MIVSTESVTVAVQETLNTQLMPGALTLTKVSGAAYNEPAIVTTIAPARARLLTYRIASPRSRQARLIAIVGYTISRIG
jgi:hypothetical protein